MWVLVWQLFQCLQDFADSQENDIHDEFQTIESVANHRDRSLLPVADCVRFYHTKQHLQECKFLPSCSENVQPLLVGQNKTGSFDGVLLNIKEQDDTVSTQHVVVDMVSICSRIW